MNEEQKQRITKIIYGMPFLGNKMIDDHDDFVEGLIANLEILQEALNREVEHYRKTQKDLREYESVVTDTKKVLRTLLEQE